MDVSEDKGAKEDKTEVVRMASRINNEPQRVSFVSSNDDGDEREEKTKEMIMHLLRIYPVLSPTMLQSGLGPQVKPGFWKPLLEDLIEEGVVVQEQEYILTPKGRYNQYNKLRLAS